MSGCLFLYSDRNKPCPYEPIMECIVPGGGRDDAIVVRPPRDGLASPGDPERVALHLFNSGGLKTSATLYNTLTADYQD